MTDLPRVPDPPTKPLLIYDGDCGFCLKWVQRGRVLLGDRIFYEPYQKIAQDHPSIPLERFHKAVQLIEPDGKVSQGAEAVFRALGTRSGLRFFLWGYLHLPGFGRLSEKVYAWVAEHRGELSAKDRCEK